MQGSIKIEAGEKKIHKNTQVKNKQKGQRYWGAGEVKRGEGNPQVENRSKNREEG